MKKPRLWTGGSTIKGTTLLAMARAARRSSPEHYQNIKVLIHELRLCNNWVRHFRKLFQEQSLRVYRAARAYDVLRKV